MNAKAPTRAIRFENPLPQAGKTLLRLTDLGTPRVAIQAAAGCRWPAQRFSCDRDGLLQGFSARTVLVDAVVHE